MKICPGDRMEPDPYHAIKELIKQIAECKAVLEELESTSKTIKGYLKMLKDF